MRSTSMRHNIQHQRSNRQTERLLARNPPPRDKINRKAPRPMPTLVVLARHRGRDRETGRMGPDIRLRRF